MVYFHNNNEDKDSQKHTSSYTAGCIATGIESMRRSVLGGALPTARQASLHLFPDFDRPDDKMTLVLMTFGQFTDHDLTRTAITKMSRDQVCE